MIFFNKDLKSNMDRFIESTQFVTHCQMIHLKSNMDRFIAVLLDSL